MPPLLSRFVSGIGPQWFSSVMGTSIVANAAVGLPWRVPWVRQAATGVWMLAATWLTVLSMLFVMHWWRHRRSGCRHHDDPVTVQFYGAPPMALVTVGSGTLLFGPAVWGEAMALPIAAVLWTAGTVGGLATTVAVPFVMFTRHLPTSGDVFAGWLLPVVPPMVSAATGAAFIPYLPAGQARLTLLAFCYGMFGISLLATTIILPQLWSRLVHHGVGSAATIPTLWIVLGPLGQSVTAAEHLGSVATTTLQGPAATALRLFGAIYGVPMLGFALMWLVLVGAITIRMFRRGTSFAMTWWSFTFPLGTCVTAASALALHSELVVANGLAVVLYGLLLGLWFLVSAGTIRGIFTGRLPVQP